MKLKNKAYLPIAKLAQRRFVIERQFMTLEKYLTSGWTIESAKNMQQRALADARFTDDRQPFTLGQFEIDTAQNMNFASAFDERLVHIAHRDEATHSG